ncbi:hypothetical protein [Mucilaginibacter ginsenosidivorax]|uniref:Uncharacterized protein n=1 Tax=Mucilaginibacter ginsenosidivorax TaxID=862126 RepID=A0A5B8VTW9_9SPHI|nr:hypothetical protein [Mucilaginibacter ginsenosidivorax]QEC75094.1 hypothetical protein FSB76_03705 [Mucilaginibacter ginsenosidivorax]
MIFTLYAASAGERVAQRSVGRVSLNPRSTQMFVQKPTSTRYSYRVLAEDICLTCIYVKIQRQSQYTYSLKLSEI